MASRRSNTHLMMRHREWKPECGHLSMTRVYHPSFQCDICRRVSKFGWMYCCTVDREALIMKAKLRGEDVAFDQIGRVFSEQMSLGKYGADLRTQKYAFLREITAAELDTYTPEQLVTILSQRDEVAAAIAKERRRSDHGVLCDAGHKYPDDQRSWMPDKSQACGYMVCQYCHSTAKDKSWVSLNGVLRGDILPTVATGFSFSYSRSRPCMEVELAKTLGCRPVCFPEDHPVSVARRTSGYWNSKDKVDSYFTSDEELSETMAIAAESSDDDRLSDSSDEFFEDEEFVSGRWTYFPELKLEELHPDKSALHKDPLGLDLNHPASSSSDPILPPKTPPTESFLPNGKSAKRVHADGRNPSSVKTNPMPRMRPFSVFPSISAVLRRESEYDHGPEEMCHVGPTSPFDEDVLERACNAPLPRPDLAEQLLFAQRKIPIGDSQSSSVFMQSDSHHTVPAVVHSPGTGVAVARMTEESVEDGLPDLVLSVEEEAETARASWGRT